jgi:hypothetical protein
MGAYLLGRSAVSPGTLRADSRAFPPHSALRPVKPMRNAYVVVAESISDLLHGR